MSNTVGLPWSTARIRSSPAPVSMFLLGRSAELPSAPGVLHEHEVPELDVALLAAVGRAALGPDVGPVVAEDLGARPARAGLAHLPEVVLAEALDALGGEADASAQISSASSSSRGR